MFAIQLLIILPSPSKFFKNSMSKWKKIYNLEIMMIKILKMVHPGNIKKKENIISL